LASLLNYLAQCVVFLEYKPSWIYHQACVTKFNELILANKNFIYAFQKACVVQLLYSLILKKSTNDLTFLTRTAKSVNKFAELKNLSIL
jgi:hypothetical protein